MEKQKIIDASDLRKYRTELPNLYDDALLDVYEFRLLAHYKRVGNCTEGIATTARKCQMSTGQVSEKRQSLSRKGWIALKKVSLNNGNFSYSITVVDKWLENFQRYTPSHSEATPSPGEIPPSHSEATPSPGETKKEPIKKEHKQEETSGAKKPRPRDPLFDAIMEVCETDPTIKGNGSSIGTVRQALLDAEPPYSPDEVRAYGRLTWHKPPTLWQLKAEIGQVRGNGHSEKKAEIDPVKAWAEKKGLRNGNGK